MQARSVAIVAAHFGISRRQAARLCKRWVVDPDRQASDRCEDNPLSRWLRRWEHRDFNWTELHALLTASDANLRLEGDRLAINLNARMAAIDWNGSVRSVDFLGNSYVQWVTTEDGQIVEAGPITLRLEPGRYIIRYPATVSPPSSAGNRPVACKECRHFHGIRYGGEQGSNVLICGMHPYGPGGELCPDWEV